MTTTQAHRMRAGRTYRFTGVEGDSDGLVAVHSVEREHGDVYVTGVWTYDGGERSTGIGTFDPGDEVDEVDAVPTWDDVRSARADWFAARRVCKVAQRVYVSNDERLALLSVATSLGVAYERLRAARVAYLAYSADAAMSTQGDV